MLFSDNLTHSSALPPVNSMAGLFLTVRAVSFQRVCYPLSQWRICLFSLTFFFNLLIPFPISTRSTHPSGNHQPVLCICELFFFFNMSFLNGWLSI